MMTDIGMMWAALVAWLLVRAVTQYRQHEMLRPGKTLSIILPTPSVTVVVPARNEARNIGLCVRHLLAQDYPALDILVVNDNSSDHTATIVSDFSCFDSRLHLLQGRALPDGWAGKPHACSQGAHASSADWLCFMDADTIAEPGLITAAVKIAAERHVDMLSLRPFQELSGFWERLIIPAGFFLQAFQHDLRRVNNPACPDAMAHGQFILIRRDVYETVGGHAAVRDEICEDTALARRVKGSGHRLVVLGAASLLRTRMRANLESLWAGLSKNVVAMLGGQRETLVASLAACALAWLALLLPIWAWHQKATFAACLISLSSLAMIATHVWRAAYFEIPFFYGLLFPIGYTISGLIAVDSIWLRWNNRVVWKGRIYAPPAAIKTAQ